MESAPLSDDRSQPQAERPGHDPGSLLGGIATDMLLLAGVLLLGWRIEEVMLTYWLEVAMALLLPPVTLGLRSGISGVIEGCFGVLALGVFTAAHSFFLVCLLYGVVWSQATGSPGGFSAPTRGQPADWYLAALGDLPAVAVAWLVAMQVVGLAVAWRQRRDGDAPPLPKGETPAPAPAADVFIMHITLIVGASVVLAVGGSVGLVLTLVALRTGYGLYGLITSRGGR
ncbi:MAG: DUF6498-containing protein [Planctomycetota bacterium]